MYFYLYNLRKYANRVSPYIYVLAYRIISRHCVKIDVYTLRTANTRHSVFRFSAYSHAQSEKGLMKGVLIVVNLSRD